MKTKREFESYFRRELMPVVRALYEEDGIPDIPARREEWLNVIDAEVQNGQLPERARDWLCPW